MLGFTAFEKSFRIAMDEVAGCYIQIYMEKDELAGNDQVLDFGLTFSWLQARVDVCVIG